MSPSLRHPVAVLVVVAALVSSCAGDDGTGDTATGEEETAAGSACRVDDLGSGPVVELTGDDPAAVAEAVATATHRCAPVVVLAPQGDGWAGVIAAAVALGDDAPLLVSGDDATGSVAGAVDALDAGEVVAVGFEPDGLDRPVTSLVAGGQAGLAETTALGVAVAGHLGPDRVLAVADGDVEARAALAGHLAPGDAVIPVPSSGDGLAAAAAALPPVPVRVLGSDGEQAEAVAQALAAAGADAARLDGSLWPERTGGTVWLADPDQPDAVAVAVVAAAGRDDVLLTLDSADLRRDRDRTTRLRDAAPERVAVVGEVTDGAGWQLETVLEGDPHPGGGFALFDDVVMVALYGHPGTPSLGALGHQDVDASVERVRAAAEPYRAHAGRVIPAFEIIATVASGSPTETGDYSQPTAVEALRPWVDRAAEEGVAVVLDLQPGRSDFLAQAQLYEELLVEPHVHLALDPEWRLEPHQRHLNQIGWVSAAEVQSVADWLAELTRRHRLPEKLLLLHQFRIAMLPDRDEIVAPPELAVVVHMDGHGPLDVKDDSYRTLTAGTEDRWLWGWKNFYDVDPVLASPERTMGLDPSPVFVSYQ